MLLIIHITADELSEISGVNVRNTKNNIVILKGLISRIGADKGGYWEIICKITPTASTRVVMNTAYLMEKI